MTVEDEADPIERTLRIELRPAAPEPPTQIIDLEPPTQIIDLEPPTEIIDVGTETVRIEAGTRTEPILVGERTERIVVGERTERIPVGAKTERLRTHPVVLPRVSTDPLDELVDRIRPTLLRAVDAMQVAAALEADGFTDRIARVEYGFADVFALAVEVYRRLGPPAGAGSGPAARARDWRQTVRLLAHGPLYALPSAVFPAVLGVLGQRSVVLGLTVAGGLGWMYAGTVAYAAYKLLGAGRPGAAARVLRVSTLGAPLAGAAAGLAVIALTGGGWGLVLLSLCQLGYQLAGTVLVFYRREAVQAATMVPAVLAGVAYLVAGDRLRPFALATAVAGVAAAYLAALWLTRGRRAPGEAGGRAFLRGHARGLTGVTVYGLCSAALLLHAEAPYLLTRLDVAVAVAPLIASMGLVEWRAERFREQAVRLTRHSSRPRDFQRGVWLLLTRETLTCLLVTAVLGLGLIALLDAGGRLSAAGAVMVAAHVALGGAYYAAFLLAGFERFGWLCTSMVAALAVHIGAGALLGASPLLGQTGAALTDTALYLGSVFALQALFLFGLAPVLGQVRHYR
jgi:hypothetical protein